MLISVAALASVFLSQKLTSAVEIPFRQVENAIVVDAQVNHHNVAVVYDTGFSGSFALTDSIDFGRPTGSAGIRDFVGTSRVNTYAITSLKLGSLDINPGDMQIYGQEGFDGSWSYGTHVDGLMGLEVMMPYVCEINMEKSKFVLHPDSDDITKRVPDNKRTFLVKILPMGARHIPIATKAPGGETLVMALDTGNSGYATTHPDSLARVGLWTEGKEPKWTYPSYIASGAVETFSVVMRGAKVFGIPVEESVWNVINMPSSGAESDGTIGFQFLKNFNITIDMRRRAVWMENFTGKFGNDESAETGITAFGDRAGKKMKVVRILSGSPAEQAGVKLGDELVAINDQVIGNLGLKRVAGLLKGPVGSQVKVQVSRGGLLKTFNLPRVMLVNQLGK